MIGEARVFDLKKMTHGQIEALGLRVLVMRRWPRGLSRRDVDAWLPDAGPSPELLGFHRYGLVSWEEFERFYRREQSEQEYCRVVWYDCGEKVRDVHYTCSSMQMLRMMGVQGKVTVMCWELGEHCHRHILVKDMNEEGNREMNQLRIGHYTTKDGKEVHIERLSKYHGALGWVRGVGPVSYNDDGTCESEIAPEGLALDLSTWRMDVCIPSEKKAKRTIYTCLQCGKEQVREAGMFYTANVPACCGQIMDSRDE